jgi:hypothetical protein
VLTFALFVFLQTTLYWKLFQMCMWDVKSRVLNLSQLGLFPKIFGQDLSKVSPSNHMMMQVASFFNLNFFDANVKCDV